MLQTDSRAVAEDGQDYADMNICLCYAKYTNAYHGVETIHIQITICNICHCECAHLLKVALHVLGI